MTKDCPCGSGLPRRSLVDARGIFCTYVCDKCEKEKRSKYRADIFSNPNYWSEELIEPDVDDSVEQYPLYPWEE